MTFHVGQKVVCVDDHFKRPFSYENRPKAKRIYTVRAIYQECFCPNDWAPALLLEEITNKPRMWLTLGFHEAGFAAGRFRPVQERKTDISIFIQMLSGNKSSASVG